MNGIASLPQGSNMPQAPQGGPPQAPGQAAPGQMPGMPTPQAQGTPMGVTSLIPPLKQLNVQQLQMELMNPGSQLPKFAVLSALDQKIKEQKAMQAVMGMQAQQQNAQDPGTVAQQVMQAAQQPVMARHGGAMHSYRQGGIVEYQAGGATSFPVGAFPGYQNPDIDENGNPRSQSEKARITARNAQAKTAYERAEAYNQLLKRKAEMTQAAALPLPQKEYVERLREFPPIGPRGGDTPESRAAIQKMFEGRPVAEPEMSLPEILRGKTGDPDIDIGAAQPRPIAPPAAQAAPPATPPATPPGATQARPQAAAPSDYERRIQELQATMGAQRNLPPELLESQRGLAALVEQQVQERQKRADEAREEARRALEEARGRQGMSAKDWFALAGGISTEKGQLMGSLGRATAGVLGGKEAEMKEAQKIYREAQALDRRERDAIGQMRILEGQRQLALKQRRYDEANQLEIQIKQLGVEAAKYGAERQDKQEQLAATRMQAEAAMKSAGASERRATAAEDTSAASREATAFSRAQGQLGVNLSHMQRDMADAEKEFAKQHSLILNLVKLGSKLTPDQEKKYQDAMAGLAATRKKIEDQYAPIINAISRQIYGQDYFKPSSSTDQTVYDFNKIGGR